MNAIVPAKKPAHEVILDDIERYFTNHEILMAHPLPHIMSGVYRYSEIHKACALLDLLPSIQIENADLPVVLKRLSEIRAKHTHVLIDSVMAQLKGKVFP